MSCQLHLTLMVDVTLLRQCLHEEQVGTGHTHMPQQQPLRR